MESLFKEKSEIEISKLRKRKKKRPSKAVFKDYNQGQQKLLPVSYEEMIPEGHMVRVVNNVVETMNIEALIKTYKGGGRNAFNPKMLLKVLVYGYVEKIYTSRRIAKALREDINFMWISGGNRPDFRTINNFRSGRLKKVIDEVFSSMVIFLTENKYIKLENYFIDGTKIQADANRYSYVWASNTKRYKNRTEEKIKELLKQIEKTNKEENKRYGNRDLEELGEDSGKISSEKISEQVKKLNEIIKKVGDKPKEEDKKIKKAIAEIETKLLPKLKKYEQQQQTLQARGSYSKTDKDATFFRMKSDQILPAYNVIIGSNEQIIINYSIHQKPSEVDRFIPHMRKLQRTTRGKLPERIIGDSAYGSEENYNFLENHQIENYLKYGSFYQQQKGINQKKRFHKDNFTYREEEDKYYCSEGQAMEMIEEGESITDNGYLQNFKKYKGVNCLSCGLLNLCSKSPQGRTIQLNAKLEEYKAEARRNLISPTGIALRKQRSTDVETIFGDIKQNQGFRKFNLRGIEKVNTEFGILAMAHNIKKIKTMIS
jgi:transposase